MKKTARLLVALILVVSLCLTASMPAFAARPGTEFLSELHLAEAKDAATAKEMLTSNGYKVFDKNLNPEGDKAVYLGYKTSADVEEAITDISVMNMNGGFSITDYETVLNESFEEYKEMIGKFRDAANEFAQNYNAKSKEALLAYRQLNYYYVEKNGQKVKMGDYMLSFPEKDEDFADILMKGNIYVLKNIRSLLAMGVGEPNVSLAQKVEEASKDETVYENLSYYEDAKTICETISRYEKSIEETAQMIEEVEADETLTETEIEENVETLKRSLSNMLAFMSILNSIKFKDTTYGEYLEKINYSVTDYSIFYPILAAMTKGQRALASLGQITEVFVYDAVEKDNQELEAELLNNEAEFTEISVFIGTDMQAFEGSFAVTNAALRNEAATGKSWLKSSTNATASEYAVPIILGVGGMGILIASSIFLKKSISAAIETSTTLTPAYKELVASADKWGVQIQNTKQAIEVTQSMAATTDSTVSASQIIDVQQRLLNNYCEKYVDATMAMKTTPMYGQISTGPIIASSIGVVIGAALLAYSIYNIVDISNSYKIEYTDIPANIVDCVDTENGDRYIRYCVVNSYYEKDGKTKTRAGDLNAYDGEQWNAIYYTKNYEAGKCMLATADWPTSEADFGKYAPVHPFGKMTVCCNLNSYNTQQNTSDIFLAFRTSTAQKAAASMVPSVVGSAINYGMLAISGVLGIGLGMGIMGMIKRKKKGENK